MDNQNNDPREQNGYNPGIVIVGEFSQQSNSANHSQAETTLVHRDTMKKLFDFIIIGAACLVVLGFFVPSGYVLIVLGVPMLFACLIISIILGLKKKSSSMIHSNGSVATTEKKSSVFLLFKIVSIIIGVLGIIWMAIVALSFIGLIILIGLAGSGDQQT